MDDVSGDRHEAASGGALPGEPGPGRAGGWRARSADGRLSSPATRGGVPRVRPRRIPGAPGAVLLVPTLIDGLDPVEARRGSRRSVGRSRSRTPVPPRAASRSRRRRSDAQAPAPTPTRSPQPARTTESTRAADPDRESRRDGPDRTARPALRAVPSASPMAAPPRGVRMSTRSRGAGKSPAARRARAGERRPQRVLRALSAVNFDRLLPPDDEARARRSARLRRVGVSLAAVVLIGVTIYAVFPVRTGLNLMASTDRARERLEAFQRENALLEEEARALREDERIEQEARELGLVLPGEESYRILPAPQAPQAPPTSTSTTVPGG